MRPTRTLTLLALLCALLLCQAPAALSEEASPPEPPPAPSKAKKRAPGDTRSEARVAEARRAAEIGRALLSSDEAVRSKAVAQFLARIEQGGDLTWFLEAMSRATRVWADRHERLMEVWLHDAVHGSAAERERAVRLLAALGEEAIRRLALELRHARLHDRASGTAGSGRALNDTPQEATGAEGQAEAQPEAAEPLDEELAAGTPRIYELQDLFARGMNPVELRSLLLKTANAVEAKQYKTVFVVTAEDKGHARLLDVLHDLRVSFRLATEAMAQKERAGTKRDAPAPPQKGATEAGARQAEAAGQERAPAVPKGRRAKPQAASDEGSRAPAAAAPQVDGALPRRVWEIAPALLHLPRTALVNMAASQSGAQAWSKLPRGLFQPAQDVIRTTDLLVVDQWMRALKRVPDARTELPLRGVRRVPSHGDIQLFAGKEIHYSKSVRRTKGGAWSIVTDTIPHGITLELTLRAEGTVLRVDVVATKTQVGLPIPVVRVQPSAQATPVELECPEWSTTRVRHSFDLPLQGGGALVSLEGLGSTAADHLVLTLKITNVP